MYFYFVNIITNIPTSNSQLYNIISVVIVIQISDVCMYVFNFFLYTLREIRLDLLEELTLHLLTQLLLFLTTECF